MTTTKRLTAAFCRSVSQPGRYGDGRGGHGLILRVHRTASGGISKSWCQRIIMHGRPTHLGLGSLALVSLKEAREIALKNRRAIHRGRDPRHGGVPTFGRVAERVIATRSQEWKGGPDGAVAKQWRRSLQRYASSLERKRVTHITGADVLSAVRPIWSTRPTVARQVLQRVRATLELARVSGYITQNVAAGVEAGLTRQTRQVKHHKTVPPGDVPAAIKRVRSCTAPEIAKLAVEFSVVTAARAAEVRGARWEEITSAGGRWVWTIPASKMKGRREHLVPLSRAALAVLDAVRGLGKGHGLVFPSPRSGHQISHSAFGRVLQAGGVACSPHGLARAAFRTWAAETGVPAEIAEAALAHTPAKITAAYMRSNLVDQRVEVMEAWGQFVAG